MKIVFISNFMNHHQLPFCVAMVQNSEIEYKFIATEPIPEERLQMGYQDMNHAYDFVVCSYDNSERYNEALDLCENADVVMFGSAPQHFIKKRLIKGKLTFRYSERIYEIKPPFYQMPLRAIKQFFKNGIYENFYLLCASAFTAADFAKTHTFLDKAYKWGYFPEVKKYDNIDGLISNKAKASILWVARLIELKHPEAAIEVAKKLKVNGYRFQLNLIGDGELRELLKKMIVEEELQDCVNLLGSMSPEKVREYMESSQIFIFTSDKKEGWGAVLNESMNSGCAVVASSAIGSVPFLIKDGENGLIYRDGDLDDLYNKVKYLLDNPKKSKCFGEEAYKTLCEEWNAENAANRFICLAKKILAGNKKPNIYDSGVCSKAEIINDKNWWLNI